MARSRRDEAKSVRLSELSEFRFALMMRFEDQTR